MIPKIIHYCWISGEENMPDDIKLCVNSWHKHLPDYQFINWNDSNFDWNICEFAKWHRENNLYAFCSDYVRFWALYNYGGIYLDSDVLVYRSFDELLPLKRILTKHLLYERENPEAAILGCEKGDEVFYKVLNTYNNSKDHYTYTFGGFKTCPRIIKESLGSQYKEKIINDISEEDKSEDVLSFLNVDKYFDIMQNRKAIAQHQFKNSWITDNHLNSIINGNKYYLYFKHINDKKYNI